MDLRQKLARLGSPQPGARGLSADVPPPAFAPDDARAEKLAQLRALIGGVVDRTERRLQRASGSTIEAEQPLGRSLPWPAHETRHGLLHRVERELGPQHHHGRVPVASALLPTARTVAALALDPTLESVDLSRMLFLDTETTGLSGGTGTVAFLVGMARFEEGALRIEQLVLPNLGAEAPMLGQLADRIRDASCIVTYNGKAFDWPLLRTRFVLARMAVPPLPAHLDLLHAARRIWKPRLTSVRLTEIEREILRFEREDDIDGAEIPGRYFAFLREGGAERLLPVIEHNQNDLIALAAMLGILGERFERGELDVPVQDALAFARVAARAKHPERALCFTQAVIDATGDRQGTLALSRAACTLAADVQRRAGDPAAAARALEEALVFAKTDRDAGPLHFALAKLYERGLGDAARAHGHARHTEPVEGPVAHGKRLGRLWRKLHREAEVASRKPSP